jgi:two-component system, cell cycle sensor histidine kinase and response regulator CckA
MSQFKRATVPDRKIAASPRPAGGAEDELATLLDQLQQTQSRILQLTADGETAPLFAGEREAVLNAFPAAAAILDANGTILSVNRVWAQFAGDSSFQGKNAAVGKNYLEICEHDDGSCSSEAARIAAGVRTVLAGESDLLAIEYPCRDGSDQRWFKLFATPFPVDGGNGAILINIEISEQRRAQEALQERQRGYRDLFELNPLPMWIYDIESLEFLDVNKAAVEHYGYSRDEFLAMTIADIRPAEKVQELQRILAESGMGSLPLKTWLHRRKDGGEILVEVTANPMSFNGRHARLVVANDVTERIIAQKAVRASEARLRAIFDSEPECVKIISRDGRLLDMNRAGLQMIEAEALDDVRGKPIFDLLHPDDRRAFLDVHERSLAGEACQLQFRLFGLKGTHRWMDTHSVPLREADGQINSVLSVTRDITQQKEMTDALRKSEERFRQLVEHIDDVFWTYDPNGEEPHYASPAFERVWGKSCEEATKNPLLWFEAIHEDDRAHVKEALENPDLEATQIEYRIVRPDGATRWIASRWIPVRDEAGKLQRILGVSRDVTSRNMRTEALRASEERFRAIAQATSDVFWDLNLKTNALWWNESFQTAFGYSADEIEPTVESWTTRIHPDDRKRVLTDIRQAITERRQSWKTEYRFLHKDGSARLVQDRGRLIFDAAGEPVRFVGGMTDITERKQVQHRLEEQTALLQQSHDAILICKLDGEVRYWNPSAERIFGWSAEEALKRNTSDMVYANPEERNSILDMLKSMGSWDGRSVFRRKDGGSVTVESSMTLLRDETGNPRAVLGIHTDITQRIALEEQVRQSQRL